MSKYHMGQRVVIARPQHHEERAGEVVTLITGATCVCDPLTHHILCNAYYDDLYPGSYGHESVYEPLVEDRAPEAKKEKASKPKETV